MHQGGRTGNAGMSLFPGERHESVERNRVCVFTREEKGLPVTDTDWEGSLEGGVAVSTGTQAEGVSLTAGRTAGTISL